MKCMQIEVMIDGLKFAAREFIDEAHYQYPAYVESMEHHLKARAAAAIGRRIMEEQGSVVRHLDF